ALPEAGPGQVVWIRPVLVGPTERYLAAKPLPAYPYPPLEHVAANLLMKMDRVGERTLKIKDLTQITLHQGKMQMSEGLRFEADVLEVLTPDKKGTRETLTIGENRFNDEFNGKPVVRSPQNSQRLQKLAPFFIADDTGRLRERAKDPTINGLAPKDR